MISPLAYVDPAAQIGQNVEIGPFVYIEGDVRIGDDCVIMPHVSILNGATIGARNVIHQNTVICAEPQSFLTSLLVTTTSSARTYSSREATAPRTPRASGTTITS